MNSLSIWLYVADVTENISTAAPPIGVILGLVGLLAYAFMSAFEMIEKEDLSKIKRPVKNMLIFSGVIFLIGTLLPSSKTMYLIAASEFGETVVTSPDTVEMFSDVKAIIKKRLAEELAE